jgi:hypothetical protein
MKRTCRFALALLLLPCFFAAASSAVALRALQQAMSVDGKMANTVRVNIK